jgi:hypothetical protein
MPEEIGRHAARLAREAGQGIIVGAEPRGEVTKSVWPAARSS